MLELLVTCYLAAQMLFAIPDGWSVERVYNGDTSDRSGTLTLVYCPPECEAERRKSFVVLRRTVSVGETVKAPEQCTMELTVRTNT